MGKLGAYLTGADFIIKQTTDEVRLGKQHLQNPLALPSEHSPYLMAEIYFNRIRSAIVIGPVLALRWSGIDALYKLARRSLR